MRRPPHAAAALQLALFLLVPLAFAPAWSAGFVNWDDEGNLLDHDRWRGLLPANLWWMLTAFHKGHWQPLTWLSFALDHELYGLQPRGYHVTNLLLHGLGAVLAFRVLRAVLHRVLGDPDVLLPAAAGALFFAVHPLRVESVAWVTERRDLLSGAFWMLAVLAWLRQEHDPRSRRAASVYMGLSLLAKAWAITLPLVFLLLDRLVLQRRESWGRLLREKLPLFALALGAALLAAAAQSAAGAAKTLAQHDLQSRVLQSGYGLSFYLWKSLWPVELSPLYPLDGPLRWHEPRCLLSLLALAALAAALVRIRRRAPGLLAAFAIYGVVLLPVLGLLQSGPQLVADRYSYLASLPLAALFAAGAYRLRRWHNRATALVCVPLLALAGLTFRQTRVWHDSRSLWQQAERVFPQSWFVQHELASAFERQAEFDAAIACWRKAMTTAPTAEANGFRHSVALTLARRGQYAEALVEWAQVLAQDPDHVEALYSCGLAHQRQGQLDDAARFYQRCLVLRPGYTAAHFNLGEVRFQQGQREAAIACFRAVLALAPGDQPTLARLRSLGVAR